MHAPCLHKRVHTEPLRMLFYYPLRHCYKANTDQKAFGEKAVGSPILELVASCGQKDLNSRFFDRGIICF